MKKLFSNFNPVEIIWDFFIILAMFVAMAVSFMIVVQIINSNQGIIKVGFSLLNVT